ncbi:hypothetical protein [Luteimonas sp. A478]
MDAGPLSPLPPGRVRLAPWLWLGASGLLLVPAAAMLLDAPGVHWTAMDFIVMGLLLGTACALYELGRWLSGDVAYRAGFGLAVLTGLLTVWVNLAVGMLGDEGTPANLMFAGVLAVAAAGVLLARFRAAGMARAMLAAGIAQLAAVAIALALGGFNGRELVLPACFALPWLVSAALFARAR